MSEIWTKGGLLTTALAVWLGTTMSLGYAENETLERLKEVVKEYSDTAKKLQKIDQFHIQVALRRAVTAERPGIPYRWSNLHTSHKGEIVLLDFIGPRGNGRLCVDFMHTYFLGGASPIEDEGTVCQNSEGEWENIIVRAVFKGTGTQQTAAIPQYNPSVVREIQTLLLRLNYNPGPVDGFYGQRTKRAIEFYQRDEGLSITGEVSEELVASLNRSIATLESLPSTVETPAVNDGPTETQLSADPGDTEGLAMEQNPQSTPPQEADNGSNSVTELTPVDEVPHPSDLASSHKLASAHENENPDLALQYEPSNDKAGVTSPVETAKADERPKVESVDVNSVEVNNKSNPSTASNSEDAEATVSKQKPSPSAIDDTESQIALAPTKAKTKTELQGPTELPDPGATQVSEGRDRVDQTQISEREKINSKEEAPVGEESIESKTFGMTTEPLKSYWVMVLIGLMFSGVAGVVASRYLSSGTSRSIARHAEMEQAAAELENKIALVVGQTDKDLDKGPKLDRNAAAKVYRDQTEVVHSTPVLKEPEEVESRKEQDKSFRDTKHLVPQKEDVQRVESEKPMVEEVPPTQPLPEILSTSEGPPQHSVDESGLQDTVNKPGRHATEPKQQDETIIETKQDESYSLEETTEGTVEGPVDTLARQPDKEDSATDSQDLIIQAISEFDELIAETEHVLAMDLEPESREHITKVIEQATKLIKSAFEKDPIEGDSHRYTRKAIRKATKLIVEVIEEHSTAETLQLRVKNK